jgi:hypothetical protein
VDRAGDAGAGRDTAGDFHCVGRRWPACVRPSRLRSGGGEPGRSRPATARTESVRGQATAQPDVEGRTLRSLSDSTACTPGEPGCPAPMRWEKYYLIAHPLTGLSNVVAYSCRHQSRIAPWTCWQTAIYCWTPFPDDQRFRQPDFLRRPARLPARARGRQKRAGLTLSAPALFATSACRPSAITLAPSTAGHNLTPPGSPSPSCAG